ncbi:hypothetical protein [Acinetobacter baumannii]|uniref:hypothetical protein n=1 Tax=Acinetobacter baumannii TaxID=470 RepID=UPI003D0794F1
MDKCREEFEKLPGISTFLPGFKFNEATNEYERSEEFTLPEYTLGFFNGAWYAFQHQRAKVEELQKRVGKLQARINNSLEKMDAESSNSWGLWKEKACMYEQGASNAYEKSYWILKGEEND